MPFPRVQSSSSGGGSSTPADGSVTDVKVASNAAIAASKIAGTAVTQADTGTVTSAMILDGTIVSGDLSASAGITSGQLAGSIAPSKITGTAITAADTGTVTSTMILDGTIAGGDLSSSIALPSGATATTQTSFDNSTKLATTAYFDANQIAAQSSQMELTARGWKAWTGSPFSAGLANSPASQSEIALKIFLPVTQSITGCVVSVTTAGATLTSGQNLVTLYAQNGTKQGSTADQSTNWATAGTYFAAFTGGPFTMTGGSGAYCWVSILSNGTTPATFRTHSGSNTLINAGAGSALTGASLIAGRIGTAVTAPATFTPSSLVTTGSFYFFIGLY